MKDDNGIVSINPLDPSQEHILESIVASKTKDDTAIIYGPPGTGKSHLIVSLLFELAVKGNRVLFVSQNTEALDVVIRKYTDLDEEFGFTDSTRSFLDFCLNLNSSEHRRNKYIKKQGERLRNKYSLQPNTYLDNRHDKVAYPFSYTHLRNLENYNIEEFSRLGMDELLAKKLKNSLRIDTDNESHMPLSLPIDMSVRKIFGLLENYAESDESFRFNNQPENELKFLSKNVVDTNFERLVDNLDSLLEDFDFDGHSYLCLKDCTVEDYLVALFELTAAAKYLRIASIEEHQANLREIQNAISDILTAHSALVDTKEVKINQDCAGDLFTKSRAEYELRIKNTTDLYNFHNRHKLAKDILNTELIERGANPHATVSSLLSSALLHYDIDFDDQFEVYPWLRKWGYEDLKKALAEISEWAKMNALKRNFSKPKWAIGKKAAEDFLENKAFWEDTLKCINGTTVTLEIFATFAAQKGIFGIKDPLANVNMGDDVLVKIINALFFLADTCNCMETPLNELLEDIDQRILDAEAVATIIDDNPNVIFESMVEALDCINNTVSNIKNRNTIEAAWTKVGAYLTVASTDELLENGEQLAQYLTEHQGGISRAFATVGNLPSTLRYSAEKIDNLRMLVSSAQESGDFSENLFRLTAGNDLSIFKTRIKQLQKCSSNMVDAFLRHNRFIVEIKNILKDSARPIDVFLSYPNISYSEFKEHLINTIVSQRYRNYTDTEKLPINDAYLDDYRKIIFERRRNHYIDGIQTLFRNNYEAAQDLVLNSKWHSARTSIETLRQNTNLIVAAFPVVIATPGEISKYLDVQKGMFDYVIFDEASQLLPGQALPAIYRSKKAVIVGDPHQMPPTLSAFITARTKDVASDDSLVEDDTVSLLDLTEQMNLESSYHLMVHYRSESNVLFEPSREAIYAKEGIEPIWEAQSDSMPIDVKDGLMNNETGFGELLRRIDCYALNDPSESCCILFTTQVERDNFVDFREKHPDLAKSYDMLDAEDKIILSTVTNCQGLDVDHSILYLGHYDNPGRMWFFNEHAGAYKRLNVAITRQKKTFDILIVDSKHAWMSACQRYIDAGEACPPNRMLSSKLLFGLLTNAGLKIDDNYLDTRLDSSLSTAVSPLVQELLEKLNDHYRDILGSEVKIWHSIGRPLTIPAEKASEEARQNIGYQIDVGIYSVKKQKFVLGIEMDGSVYHDHHLKSFSDSQRGAILKIKKWNLYRIWSVNWLKDTKKEFDSLTRVIDQALATDNN